MRFLRSERDPIPTSDRIMHFNEFMIVIVIVMPTIEWNVCTVPIYRSLPYFTVNFLH